MERDSSIDLELSSFPCVVPDGSHISVQLPQVLLKFSSQILLSLRHHCSGAFFTLLADSAFSECCIDYTSAAHLDAFAICKIGYTCASPSSAYHCPVYTVPFFYTNLSPFWVCDKILSLSENIDLVYIVCPFKELRLNLEKEFEVRSSKLVKFVDDISNLDGGACIFHFSMSFSSSLQATLSSACFKVFSFDGSEFKQIDRSKLLSQRYLALSKISGSGSTSFGVIVQSTSKLDADFANTLSQTIKKYGYPSYIFSIGRISPTKLGNFPDIQVWIIVGCPEPVLIPKENYYAVLLTPYEGLCFLSLVDLWTSKYIFDRQEMLDIISGSSSHVPITPNSSSSEVALRDHLQYSTLCLSNKHFRGIPEKIDELIDDDKAGKFLEIQRGLTGVPRSYSTLSHN